MKTIEIDHAFAEAVAANNGYCPCLIEQNEDTLCPCKEFREQTKPGRCHCGRYEKVEDSGTYISQHFVTDGCDFLVLEPEDWTAEEFGAFMKIFGLQEAERIVINEYKLEAWGKECE